MITAYPVARPDRPIRRVRPDSIPARDLVAGDHVRWQWSDDQEVSGVLAEAVTFDNDISRSTFVKFAGKDKARLALSPDRMVTLLSVSPLRKIIDQEV